jgi:hypothetical protein
MGLKGLLQSVLLAGLVFVMLIILIYGKESGPVHFSLNGAPDRIGNQKPLAILPMFGIILYFGLNWLKQKKNLFNYPVKITPENRVKQETLIVGFIENYAMITLAIFNLLSFYMIYSIYSGQAGEIWFIVLIFISGYTLPILTYIRKAKIESLK